MASKMAMEHGWSINLGGGLHHSSFNRGEGFCCYPDISLAINHVWEFYEITRIMIIDLDAHQGNGHERDFMFDENVFIVDFFCPDLAFPKDNFAI